MDNNVAIVIPARYASSRFPGKPLVKIGSRVMIEHVYNACLESAYNPNIYIATDNEKIFNVCKTFIKSQHSVVITPTDINTGSERVAWVASNLIKEDFVLNVQGDEPLLTGKVIDALIKETLSCDELAPVATLAKEYQVTVDDIYFKNPNSVKLVTDKNNYALYFSRSPIPGTKKGLPIKYLKHIGLYGLKKDFLLQYPFLSSGDLEQIEELEQLRILEHGYRIKVAYTDCELVGVDTPEDIKIVEKIMEDKKQNEKKMQEAH